MRSKLSLETNEREDGRKNREVNGFEVCLRLDECWSMGSRIYELGREEGINRDWDV